MPEQPGPIIPGGFVTCSKCRRRYILCPMDDYFNATDDKDGLCESCLLAKHGLTQSIVVNPAQGEKLQKEFESKRRRQ